MKRLLDIIGLMKRIVPFSLIGLGAFIVIASFGWAYFDNLIRQPASIILPEQLSGLPLSSQLNGLQAVEEFNNLHGKKFPITSGSLGIYGNQQVTLWVAGTPMGLMAANMVISMHEKIAVSNSPFTPTREYLENKRTIYQLEGMGQSHFYFQSNNLVIWLAADADIAEITLQQLKEFYP